MPQIDPRVMQLARELLAGRYAATDARTKFKLDLVLAGMELARADRPGEE